MFDLSCRDIYLLSWLSTGQECEEGGERKHAGAPFLHTNHIAQSPLKPSSLTTFKASNYMHRGPHAWLWAWSKSKVDPQQKSGTCARKWGRQAEASTLLHESSNSEPETIKQGETVFHYIRVRVARVGIIPLVGTKPVTINREHTHIFLLQLHKIQEYTLKETKSCLPTWGDKGKNKKLVIVQRSFPNQ